MVIDIQVYDGASLTPGIAILTEFRLRSFREFPYLYAGTEEGEQEHMTGYIANPTARLLLARDTDFDEKVVGVAIGTLLSTETEILRQMGEPLRNLGIVPEEFYYLGEMIFVPGYWRRGIGRQMLEVLKAAGREQGANRFGFLAVFREPNDSRRPAGHIDSGVIFRRFGFENTNIFVTFDWTTIHADGRVAKSSNRLSFWVDRKIEENP